MDEMVVVNESFPAWAVILFIVVVIIDIVLKGVALYRAGQNGSKGWFVVMFIFNTAGILPIIYLLTHRNTSGVKGL